MNNTLTLLKFVCYTTDIRIEEALNIIRTYEFKLDRLPSVFELKQEVYFDRLFSPDYLPFA